MKKNFIPAFPLDKRNSITGKNLSEQFKFVHAESQFQNCIHSLRWMNCFIGANNSGKSRCIRALFGAIETASKNDNELPYYSVKKTPIIQLIIENKVSFNEKTQSNWADILDDLSKYSSYIFDNYASIYKYWNDLKQIEKTDTILEKWYLALSPIKKWLSQKLGDINQTINNSKGTIEGYQAQIIENEKKRTDYIQKKQQRENLALVLLKKLCKEKLDIVSKIHPSLYENNRLNQLQKEIQSLSNVLANAETLSLAEVEHEIQIKGLQELDTKNINSLNQELQKLKNENIEQKLEQIKSNVANTEAQIKKTEEDLKKQKMQYQMLFKSTLKSEIISLVNEGLDVLTKVKIAIPKLYIPILRGTRSLDDQKTDFYANRTYKDYRIKNTFTGLSIYGELQNHLLGSYEERALIKGFEEFLSESFFNGKSITLIPRLKSDVVFIRIGEDERPIYELGDGVQALITLTFPLFLRKNEEWAIFIEEPEAHLHPRWQRFFVDTIKKYFQNHQFFFTTHSNVFLNDEDISVYRVSQDETDNKTAIQYVDTDHSSILEELGYKSSDLMNANYILWVEGISDKFYLKQFIYAYDNTLKEGVHYSIMFYGGCTNLTEHISVNSLTSSDKVNILSINPNCGFIVDSDLEEGEKLEINQKDKCNFKMACAAVDKFCWITTTREIENLIPLDIWKKAAISYAKSLPNNGNSNILPKDVELVPENEGKNVNAEFGDRTHKKKGTKVNISPNVTVRISDKGKIAKEVAKIFPKNKVELNLVPEIFNNIKLLVDAIKKANRSDREN